MRGVVTYEKKRELLTTNERFAIDALVANGFSLTVRAENPTAPANIDLEIDGKLWELKNVTNTSSSVGNQLRRARRKWWVLGLPGPLQVIFSTEGATDSAKSII